MTDGPTRQKVEDALARFQSRVEEPRSIVLSADDRALLRSAVERVRAQLLGPSEPVLTIALAGGTGVGKSTLINSLAGRVIAEASEIRPTTRQLQIYHHRDDNLGNLTEALAGEATFVAHDRPELRGKMLVDAPDLDSFVVRHRATTKALLKRAGLVLYVFSPERYLEERTWSVLREETEFSACAAVLNKVDRVESAIELEQIIDDLRERFQGLGFGDIRIFRICARAHIPDANGKLPGPPPLVDDMVALRAFIERELQASEIAQMLRAQRTLAVTRLKAEVDQIAPEAILARLNEVARSADALAARAGDRLAEQLADQLAAVEAELAPLLTLRRHERYWGPFRTWLAVVDFIGFGLTSLARRLLGRAGADRMSVIESILIRGGTFLFEERLRSEAHALQDLLYARGLPVERWRGITARADGARLVAEVTAEIEAHFEVSAARVTDWQLRVAKAASTLGGVALSAFVLVGLVVMSRDLLAGRYAGFALFWHGLAMVVLFFLALQGVIDVLLPGGTRWLGLGVGTRTIHLVIGRTLAGWIASYRADLEADIADLREPLQVVQAALASGGDFHRPTPDPSGTDRPPYTSTHAAARSR